MKNLLVDFKFALPIFSRFSIKLKLKYKHRRAPTALEKELYVLEKQKHHITYFTAQTSKKTYLQYS